ncbi:hypothetical protein Scep_013905 [Stephania cephalantha]|uniref:Uncharacterized protein n=1 Tax=Stephania cephalantha TaxID=152367 RepID=A0AAP0J0A5_9MAGN
MPPYVLNGLASLDFLLGVPSCPSAFVLVVPFTPSAMFLATSGGLAGALPTHEAFLFVGVLRNNHATSWRWNRRPPPLSSSPRPPPSVIRATGHTRSRHVACRGLASVCCRPQPLSTAAVRAEPRRALVRVLPSRPRAKRVAREPPSAPRRSEPPRREPPVRRRTPPGSRRI